MAADNLEQTVRYPAETVRAQIEAILRAWGMREADLALTAGIMAETDLRGIDSHGIGMLVMYAEMQRAGRLDLRGSPRIVRERASTALIDGGAGLGHPVAAYAMRLAVQKAQAHDVGIVSVRNSHHFGAAGLYAEMAAEQGLIGIVSTTTRTVAVVPTHGAVRVLGTNPFAFAAPARRHPIVLLDMSTSVAAVNKIRAYARRDRPLPEGWVLDAAGRGVTDAAQAFAIFSGPAAGGLSPLGGAGTEAGGHKGYGLALFAQILSGTLGGGSFSPLRELTQKPDEPDNIGHFFQVLNPAAFRPFDEFLDEMDSLIDLLRATPAADPARPVLLPGEPERQARAERLVAGIPIPDELRRQINGIALDAGAASLLS